MSALTNYGEAQMVEGLYRTGKTTIAVWPTSTALTVGEIYRPSTWNDRFFQVVAITGDNTTAASEPTWNVAIGDETTDNNVTWQAIALGVPKRAHFIALYTSAPGETGGGTEVSGGSYARVQLNPLDANWTDVSGGDGETDNAVEIVFPAPTANWGEVVSMAKLNRSSGGNMFDFGSLVIPQTINNGQQAPKFTVGAATVTFD